MTLAIPHQASGSMSVVTGCTFIASGKAAQRWCWMLAWVASRSTGASFNPNWLRPLGSARTTAPATAGAIPVLTPAHRAKLPTNSTPCWSMLASKALMCLVGHSAAGKDVRLFANRYPQAVVGMVLIDARHESVDTNRSPEALAAEHTQQRRFQRTIWAAARLGLVRAFWAAAWPQVFPATQNLSTETRAEIGVLQARSQQVKTVLREDALLTHDNAQLSSATSLGDVPLMVLAAGQNVEHDPLWLPAQQQLAGLSSNAKLIVVEGSSHYIHWDQPMLVAGAIRQVVEAARTDQH